MDLKKLCIKLAKSDDGNDVIKVLKDHKLWDDMSYWETLGGAAFKDKNTESIVGAQQSDPVNALVEKLINSGDSTLILKAREKGIDPKSKEAPKTVKEGMETLLDVTNGKWINVGEKRRINISKEFCNLVATGQSGTGSKPCMTVYDHAEGQAPENFEDSFLGIIGSIKTSIPFVQGRFGMGSFGAVKFCSIDGLQLIISKRNPKIQDGMSSKWGFTIIREIQPDETYTSSQWKYLKINNEIPSFDCESLPILPTKYPDAYGKDFKYGSFIKMYNYEMPGMASAITFDLTRAVRKTLVNPVVPIRFIERRKFKTKPKTPEATMNGLEYTLEDNRSKIFGYESGHLFNVFGDEFKLRIVGFNETRKNAKGEIVKTEPKRYSKGVMFTYNGQVHHTESSRFFEQGRLPYSNIKDHLLLLVDCSEISNKTRQNIFQNSRETMRKGENYTAVKDKIISILRNDKGLREFSAGFKAKSIKRKLSDQSKFEEHVQKLIKTDSTFAKFLGLIGGKISNPLSIKGEIEKDQFKPSYFPNFFNLDKSYDIENPRLQEKGRSSRIAISTDAPDDYLIRSKDPGEFKVIENGNDITNQSGISFGGSNGKWHLTLPPMKQEESVYFLNITDVERERIVDPFQIQFYMKEVPKVEKKKYKKKKKPKLKSNLSINPPIHVHEDDYDAYGFDHKDLFMGRKEVGDNDKDEFRTYINMDNIYLHNYLNRSKSDETEVIKRQFEVASALLSYVLSVNYEKDTKISDKSSLPEYTKNTSRSLSPVFTQLIRDWSNI